MYRKKLTIAAIILILCGVVIAGICFVLSGFSFTALSKDTGFQEQSRSFYLTSQLNYINLDMDNADIVITPSKDDKINVTCTYSDNSNLLIGSDNNTITVKCTTDVKENILSTLKRGFFSIWQNSKCSVCVEIPANTDITLKLNTDNGSISMSEISGLGNIEAKTDNGKIHISSIDASDSVFATSNGDISFKNSAFKTLDAHTNNGNIKFNSLNSPDISFRTSNGNISGSVVGSEANYILKLTSQNGSVTPKSKDDGTNQFIAKSGNGNIKINFTE